MPRKLVRITPEIETDILEALRTGDTSLTAWCEEDRENRPCDKAIYLHRVRHPEFDAKFNIASREGYEKMAERELIAIKQFDPKGFSIDCASKVVWLLKKSEKFKALDDATKQEFISIIQDNALDNKILSAKQRNLELSFRAAFLFLSKLHPARFGDKLTIDKTETVRIVKDPDILNEKIAALESRLKVKAEERPPQEKGTIQ